MRTLNLRFAALLLVITAVLAGGVHLLHGFQMRRNAHMFLREAERARAEKKSAEAVRHYQRYLEFMPDDTAVLADYAVVLADLAAERAGARRAAYETLERALRADPQRSDLRRRLVPLALQLGRFSDAQEHLTTHLLPAAPDDPELLLWLARSQRGLGKHAEAVKSFERVIARAPAQRDAYLGLAEVLRGPLQRPVEADAAMHRLTDANPNSWEAWLAKGRYLFTTRPAGDTARLEQAALAAAAALKLAPDNTEVLHLAAQCALEQKNYDEARKHAARAIELDPQFAAGYLLLASVEVRADRRAEAIAWLRRGIEAQPNDAMLVWNLANVLLDDQKTDEIDLLVRRLQSLGHPGPLVEYLRARKEYVAEQWLVASRHFERLRPALTAWPDVVKQVDFWLGGCYRALGNADQQLAAYRRAVSVDPFWIPARAGVAAALLSIGRVEEALDEYRELMRLAGAPAAGVIDLAQLEILKNLRLPRAQRNWAEAERLLGVAEKALHDNSRIAVLRAEILVAQDRAPDAEKLLQTAQAKNPQELALRLALAGLAERRQDWAEAERHLAQAERDLGDSVSLRLARAQYFVARYGKEAAPRLASLLDSSGKFAAADVAQLERGIAAACLRIGQYGEARRLCQSLARREPNNLQVRLLLFDLALRAQDDTGLGELLDEIKQIEGEGAFWHYGSALHLALQAQKKGKPALQEAQKHLVEARNLRPAWSRVALLAAHLCEQEGNEELAIEQYLRAVNLGERNPQAIRRLVQLLAERQRYAEADRVLRTIEEQSMPLSAELNRLASDISLRLDDFDRALELARQAARVSNQYQDHVWLGQVLGILGQRARIEKRQAEAEKLWAEAQREFRQAIQMSNQATAAWVALVQFLGRTGQKEEAQKALAEAQQKIPPQQAPLALALCYEAIQDLEQAEKKYQEALAAAPGEATVVRQTAEFYLRSGKAAQAEPHLRRLAAGEVKAKDENRARDDRIWSRRALALLLLGKGHYENLLEGLDLVEQNLKEPNPAIQDQRAKALLLSAMPRREQQEEAVRLLEQVLRDYRGATPEDRFVLARLYLRLGSDKWSQATRHFRALIAAAPNEPRYVAAYGAALLARKELSEAEIWVNRLEQIAPGQLPTLNLRAVTLCERNEHEKALSLLQGYLEQPESKGEDRPARVLAVASTLEDLGQRASKGATAEVGARFLAEAEKLFRQYCELRPEQRLVLAAFLARHNRMEEAVALAEQAWPTSRPELIGPAMMTLLSGAAGQPTPYQARAEKILHEAIAKHNRPVAFLVILADYLGVHNRVAEAEALYREVLQKNPNHIAALNNLAMLLALQGKQLDEAQQLVNRAIELTGPSANSLDSRAAVYLARGRAQEALKDIEAVIADTPVAMAYFRKAQILVALDRRAEATEALKTAQKMGLKAELLHPLERPAFENLCKSLL